MDFGMDSRDLDQVAKELRLMDKEKQRQAKDVESYRRKVVSSLGDMQGMVKETEEINRLRKKQRKLRFSMKVLSLLLLILSIIILMIEL